MWPVYYCMEFLPLTLYKFWDVRPGSFQQFREWLNSLCTVKALSDQMPYCVITKTRLFKYTENFTTKNWKFSDKKFDSFHISAQNIHCGYSLELPCRGSSNEYSQSMFLSRNMKNNINPCKPKFYYIKVGFKGSKLYRYVFVMGVWISALYL